MRLIITLAILILAQMHRINSTPISFDHYKLVRLVPKTKEQIELIVKWEESSELDLWNNIRGLNKSVDVLLSPVNFKKYDKLFDQAGLKFQVLNNNIQKSIDEEKTSTRNFRQLTNPLDVVGKYGSYEDILRYLDYVAKTNWHYASTYTAGKTIEGRDMVVLRLKSPTAKRAIWIDCGIHAREWITVSTCVWIINRFVSEYNSFNPKTLKLLNNYEIHIMPMLNPDGYVYSQKENRMWRKNRNPNGNVGCNGVDLNRNFGYYWLTSGASRSPCSEVYAGAMPNSELETKNLQKALMAQKGKWDSYITLHSYGNYWFTPFGYGPVLPPDYDDMYARASVAANAVKSVYGTQFKIGSSANLLYSSSGGSDDWAKAIAGIKYSYCIELRPDGDDYSNGFVLPETEIPLAGEEMFVGIKTLINSFIDSRLYYNYF